MNFITFLIILFVSNLTFGQLDSYTQSGYDNYLERSPFYEDERSYNFLKDSIQKKIKNSRRKFKKDRFRKILKELETKRQDNTNFHNLVHNEKTCTPVDLRSDRIGEVRNQGGIGWCFAYGLSDLISAKIGFPINARDLALKYNLSHKQGPITANTAVQGGNSIAATKFMSKQKICKDPNFESNNKSRVKVDGRKIKFRDLFLEVESLQKLIKEKSILYKDNFYDLYKLLSTGHRKLMSYEKDIEKSICKAYNMALEIFDDLDFLTFYHSLIQTSYDQMLKDWIKLTCKETTILPELQLTSAVVKQRDPKHMKTVQDFINETLDKNDPSKLVGIAYDSGVLRQHEYMYNEAKHFSTVVGRRFKDGKCQYMIRNTWGKEYKHFGQGDENPGYAWLDANALLSNMSYAISLK